MPDQPTNTQDLHREVEQLREALRNRAVIGQAGILMERYGGAHPGCRASSAEVPAERSQDE